MNLKHVNISQCKQLTSPEVHHLLRFLRGRNITTLDLSGCSSKIDDNVIRSMVPHAPNLEYVNLSKAKKVTEYGVGMLAWVCHSSFPGASLTARGHGQGD